MKKKKKKIIPVSVVIPKLGYDHLKKCIYKISVSSCLPNEVLIIVPEDNYNKVKKKYLKFLTSQEVMSEPFRDKLGQLNKFYLPISKMIAKDYLKKKKTKIIGLTGGQGTGKSTISNILKIILKEAYKLETVIFSIDDFYKTLSERKKISKKISPLFLTRGVPGTHDTKMLLHCINNLKNNNFKRMIIPKFDKSADDRCSKNKWSKVKKKPNI